MVNNQNTNPTRNPETLWKRFGTEIVTLNRETRQYHVLNAAAAIIFQSATGDNTIEDIAEIISEVFGIDIGQALSDARETVEGMEKLGLISAS
jgi:2C-methyl-D-erythritol 2,4-cyclodiphosphate synthase